MSKSTNLFQDAWAGWTDFVREIVGRAKPPFRGRGRTPDLKTKVKPPNRAQLKRDLNVVRRPQPKPGQLATSAREEATKLKREPLEDVPEIRVDPPKPFKLKEEFLETPPERVSRLEKEQKKKASEEEGGGLVTAAAYYQSAASPTVLERWYAESAGTPPELLDGWGHAQVGGAV